MQLDKFKTVAVRGLASIFIVGSLAGCGTVDLATIKEMIGLSKRTYNTKAEPTAGATGSATGSTTGAAASQAVNTIPIVIAPPVSSNANANAPDFIQYRIAAAKKIMVANSSATYGGDVPNPLASIPVLEISLNSDGSVAAMDVLRKPHFFPETIELAKAAVRRAAPFGSVAHLPRPWTFNETFLFNDDLKFQLHALQP